MSISREKIAASERYEESHRYLLAMREETPDIRALMDQAAAEMRDFAVPVAALYNGLVREGMPEVAAAYVAGEYLKDSIARSGDNFD